jgi:alpha-ketoglutaric semialdehyde dehydrogenase
MIACYEKRPAARVRGSTIRPMTDTFHAFNPTTGEALAAAHPVATWPELDAMAEASVEAATHLAATEPSKIATFLRTAADRLDANRAAIAAIAHEETGLPLEPRLAQVEFDRMLGQLRQAADAAEDVSATSWRCPLVDEATNIRSDRGPLGGAVFSIGPNNFPLAFHGVSGGDFAAAIAAGNPVIAKGHPLHPATGRLLADTIIAAARDTGLHPATVQYVAHCPPEDGLRLIADPRIAAVAFTGSRAAGLAIKAAADASGTPAYLEMSSLNPVFALPGALANPASLAEAWAGSVTLGAGQFCTKPGVYVTVGSGGDAFVEAAEALLGAAAPGVLFSQAGVESLASGIATVETAGATRRCGGRPASPGFRFEPTLLVVDGATFLARFDALERELFGPAGLVVTAANLDEACAIARRFEGQLTATICTGSGDDAGWNALAAILRPRCGRLLENKMPTGVAVVPSMVHGGPYPATGHPGFTAVGLPTSIARFTQARCWDGVAPSRLPDWLR